jgi:ribonuclease BN (tRNA processing enzyme)
MKFSRRKFISIGIAALAMAPIGIRPSLSQSLSGKTRLILLGVGGGPRPRKNSYATSQVVVLNNEAYVIDCGDGVATQLVRAGIPLSNLRHVFITHHHSDHNADYGNLLLLAWTTGLKTRVDTWGPKPLKKITKLFFKMSAVDIKTRMQDEGRSPIAGLFHPHEIKKEGVVFTDEKITVRTAVVDHGLTKPALAYRIDTKDRSIVISGDTVRSDALVQLAKGADVLVHEAMFLPAIDRLAARLPQAANMKSHLLASHTSAEDAGRVAKAAGVKTLVLSHFVPADDPTVTDEMWIDAARKNFDGEIIVGKDLMEI